MKARELKMIGVVAAILYRSKRSCLQLMVLSCIGLHPGIHYRELGVRLGVGDTRLNYHLRELQRVGDIIAKGYGRERSYFMTNGGGRRLDCVIMGAVSKFKAE